MHQRGLVVLRQVLGQPVHEPLHRRRDGHRGLAALARPARDLAAHVVARFAVVGQAHGGVVHGVQRGDHAVHLAVDGGALGRVHAGQRLVHEHAALQKLHHVERRAQQRRIVAVGQHARHGHGRVLQRAHHAVLAVDGVGRCDQRPRGLLAQHVVAAFRRGDAKGGVGLPARQYRGRERPRARQALRAQVVAQRVQRQRSGRPAHSELTRCAPSTATVAPDMAAPASDASNSSGPSRSVSSPKRRLGMRLRSLSPASLVRKSRFRSVTT